MPAVPTTFVEDTGAATPALNILNVLGGTGIDTSGAGNTVTITLEGGLSGTGNTVGAVTADLITLPLGATPGTYTFDLRIAGFDATTPLSCGYTLVGAVRTTGAAAVLITGQALDEFEENAVIDPATAEITVGANNAIVRVTGAAGLTINWKCSGEYVFVS